MEFAKLVEVLEELEATSKRGTKTAIIASLLNKTHKEDLDMILLLLQGHVFSARDKSKLNVAAKTMLKALAQASGHSNNDIEKLWKQKGDLGLVAHDIIIKKKQATLFSETLTVKSVFNDFRKLAAQTGANSVYTKTTLIAKSLTSATPLEAKFITRIALEVVRVGIGEGTLRDALIWSAFPNIVLTMYPKQEEEGIPILREFAPTDFVVVSNMKEFKEHMKDPSVYSKLRPMDDVLAREMYKHLSKSIQHAYNMCNELPKVAIALKEKGLSGIEEIDLTINTPVQVMLAQKVANVKDGLKKVGKPAAIEYKYDGFRMQIHISGDNVTLYTRRLEDVTKQFPDVVKAVKENVECKTAILDSEAVGFNPNLNTYQPFQQISQRIRRKYDIERLIKKLPVELNVFDVLYFDGETLIDKPLHERRKVLTSIITPKERVIAHSRITITDKEEEVNKFYQESLDAGNEGIMLKSLDSPYQPGSRVGFMVKLKPIMDTLDLVIVEATWGEGKRSDWITSYTVACIDEDGQFLTVGKVSTGLKELEEEGTSFKEMTELLKPLVIAEKGKDVIVKPEIVIEVAYEEIQKSPTYTSSYALRFPRFIRIRERDAEGVSPMDYVEDLYNGQ
jgi:DNA ligase 1